MIAGLACLGIADQCVWVSDHCPVAGGHTTPKCRIDDEECSGDVCSRKVCTVCNARALGCSVDLNGVVAGTIIGVDSDSV